MRQDKPTLRVLYLTYDGLGDPLGQSQVEPLVHALNDLGHQMTVLSFEKPGSFGRKHRLPGEPPDKDRSSKTFKWIRLRYHKRVRLASTLFDLLHASVRALPTMARADIVHCRSYVLAPLGLIAKWLFGAKFLFDIRGLWLQERIDGALLNENSALALVSRQAEKVLFRQADWIVTLTRNSLPVVRKMVGQCTNRRVSVIPTFVDLKRFAPETRSAHGRIPTVCYVGSLGTWYDSSKLLELARCVTGSGWSFRMAVNNLDGLELREFVEAGVEFDTISHSAIPKFLSECDVSAFFIRPTPSKVASAPTKLAESLAAGLPILTSPGIGDVDDVLTRRRVGVILSDSQLLDCREILEVLRGFQDDPELRDRCFATAESEFSFDSALQHYVQIYAELTE